MLKKFVVKQRCRCEL